MGSLTIIESSEDMEIVRSRAGCRGRVGGEAGAGRVGSSKAIDVTFFFLIVVADFGLRLVIMGRVGEGEGARMVRRETVEAGKGAGDSKISARSRASLSTLLQ